MVSAERITAFCQAIRAKDGWEAKILDEKRNLGLKWAQEAQLLLEDDQADPEDEFSDNRQQILGALRELEAEARRIIHYDLTQMSLSDSQRSLRSYDWERMHTQAINAYKYLKASEFGISPAEDLSEEVGVFTSDDVVPLIVQTALKSELDLLANAGPKDFHPGTDGRVQDIIHPSLYPYTLNVTPLNSGTRDHPQLKGERLFHSKMRPSGEFSDTITYESRFAWIPSIFRVSPDGTSVEIQSYINGLGPRERHPEIYKVLEEVFLVAMPLLEKSVNHHYDHQESDSVKRWHERHNLKDNDMYESRIQRDRWENLAKLQQENKEKEKEQKESERRSRQAARAEEENLLGKFNELTLDDEKLKSTFAGKDLRVIVKAANYILKPGQDYVGSWHIEGMPHERIIASAIYYYDTDEDIVDNGLSFRRLRNEASDFPEYMDYRHEDFMYRLVDKFPNTDGDEDDEDEDEDEDLEHDYPSDWEPGWTSDYVPRNIDLGTVPTTNFSGPDQSKKERTGRIISFPNWIQHKVEGLLNSAEQVEMTAHRKILCFFLVSEKSDGFTKYPGFDYSFEAHHVLTTADVPYQARGCNFATLHSVLPMVCQRLTNKPLPAELVELIINAGHDPIDMVEFADRNGALGMSWKAAEERRRAVMADRRARASKDDEEFKQSYSLCEH